MAVSRWERIRRWGSRHETAAFLLLLGLAGFLIGGSTLLPALDKNATLAEREAELDAQLVSQEAAKLALEQEVEALESDPYTIEMKMREVLRQRRADEVPLEEWLSGRAGSPAPTGATPAPTPDTDSPTTP